MKGVKVCGVAAFLCSPGLYLTCSFVLLLEQIDSQCAQAFHVK